MEHLSSLKLGRALNVRETTGRHTCGLGQLFVSSFVLKLLKSEE